ncbi:ComEC/Rec2 family competence protein [Flavihumibacter fluvii]|uniref:ComEC/Rec2 family competence protein n=1 Tax=Flavihumibacter fluvii TaxID=2838157 RepID=UPI001BDEDF7E|nr:ComEC/Rec2 family competence protein [Flavihumibacter fluvii]ULQ51238.1 ComEC family competence protein [Flavihumibacter fluvii]
MVRVFWGISRTMNLNAFIWYKAPFLRLLPPLIGGIYWGEMQVWPVNILYTGLATFFMATSCLAAKIWLIPYRTRWLTGLSINLLLFSMGMVLIRECRVNNKETWLGHHLRQGEKIMGTPATIATPGKKTSRVKFSVYTIIDSAGQPKKVTGTILLYVPPAYLNQFIPGDIWVIKAKVLEQIRSSRNPASFDYALYCARQNIFHQAYLKEGQFKKIGEPASIQLSRLLAYGQLSALKAMRETVPEKASGLAMALLIGYRSEVDKSLLQAYTNTGVVHVIAVSGMHLGLIFGLLQGVLIFPDKRFKFFKWLKACFVLLTIWWFSGVAGAAASIIRAAFMFSIALLAKLIRKPMDSIQLICLGAFALLCYNPLWLWDAGFQLSFTALLSIICYQPLINTWVELHNPVLKAIWQLIAVTLSAQVLTLPISIGQFHQAPIYFLLANLLAIPLSSLALITALLQWIISIIGIQFPVPGQVTGFLIENMNTAILHINMLPGAVISQIEWTVPQTLLVYVFIIALTTWFIHHLKTSIWICFISLACHTALGSYDRYKKNRQEILVAFHLPQKK